MINPGPGQAKAGDIWVVNVNGRDVTIGHYEDDDHARTWFNKGRAKPIHHVQPPPAWATEVGAVDALPDNGGGVRFTSPAAAELYVPKAVLTLATLERKY